MFLAAIVLAAGSGAAYYFRKLPQTFEPAPASPSAAAIVNDYRAVPKSHQSTGPVPAALLDHPVPRLLGRIDEVPADVRPLGVARDAPPQLPEMFITNNGAFEAGVLDE